MFVKITYNMEVLLDFYNSEQHFEIEYLKYKGKQDFEEKQVPMAIANYLSKRYPYISRKVFLKAIKNKENIKFPIKVKQIDDKGDISYCEMIDENGTIERVAIFYGDNYKIIECFLDGFASVVINFELILN